MDEGLRVCPARPVEFESSPPNALGVERLPWTPFGVRGAGGIERALAAYICQLEVQSRMRPSGPGTRELRGSRSEVDSKTMDKIRIAIVGVGNCASSLVQGIAYYRGKSRHDAIGLMHWEIGGYRPQDIEVVAAFDIDVRKVGKDVSEAIFEPPNCTTVFCEDLPKAGVRVGMGCILDGVADHMKDHPEPRTFLPSDEREATQEAIVLALRQSEADVLLNYLPVGSERAARFYAECALEAEVALVNCIPVFIASDPAFAQRFEERGLPIVGDDIKAQLGATITHRMLTDLFRKRGVKLERTYQLNTGGNTDFLNMLNRSRLASKKESKTEAVQSVAAERIPDENIHIVHLPLAAAGDPLAGLAGRSADGASLPVQPFLRFALERALHVASNGAQQPDRRGRIVDRPDLL